MPPNAPSASAALLCFIGGHRTERRHTDGLPVFLPWPTSAGGHFGAGGRELLPEPVGETEWYIPHGKLGDQ